MQANNILIYRNPFSSLMVLTALLLITLCHTLTTWGQSVAWALSSRLLVMKTSAHMYLKHLYTVSPFCSQISESGIFISVLATNQLGNGYANRIFKGYKDNITIKVI